MYDDTSEAMTGSMVTLLLGGCLAGFILKTGLQPEVATALRDYSPWVAANVATITWTAAITILLTAIAIPPIYLRSHEGWEKMATFGRVLISAAAIPAIGYLLGLGWVAANMTAR